MCESIAFRGRSSFQWFRENLGALLVLRLLQKGMGIHQDSHSVVSFCRMSVLLRIGHWHRLKPTVRMLGGWFSKVVELVLAEMIDNAGPQGVAEDIDRRSEPVQ